MVQNITKTIGLFDSGLGGLSVLSRLLTDLPESTFNNFRFVYLADTARCPYGGRSPEQITAYVEQIITWLLKQKPDHILIACNTSASIAGELIRKSVSIPVADTITPVSAHVAKHFKNIAVMATKATCHARAFTKAIQSFNPKANVLEIPCPDLVPLVETGLLKGKDTRNILQKYSQQVLDSQCDALILGCTHFPFLRQELEALLSDLLPIIDPAEYLSYEILGKQMQKSPNPNSRASLFAAQTYYVTGEPEDFQQGAQVCLDLPSDTLKDKIYQLPLDSLINASELKLTDKKKSTKSRNQFFSGVTNTQLA